MVSKTFSFKLSGSLIKEDLRRFWTLSLDSLDANTEATAEMIRERNKLAFDITTRLEQFSLNTVISAFMEHNNKLMEIAKKEGGVDRETIEVFTRLLAPFAPHVAEEVWERYGHEDSVFHSGWPAYDKALMADDTVQVPVQINGKTRVVISVAKDISKEDALAEGKKAVESKLTGNVIKEVYVPGKIINFVMK